MLVVLLIADSVRADAPGFGGGTATTPLLDQLAREGTSYTQCISSAAWTVPSLIALTTGTLPHRLGVSRWRHPFPAGRPTIMSAFADAGFDVHSCVHNPRFCLTATEARGNVWDSEEPEEVLRALSAPSGSDRFVLIHHWWTHLPYISEKLPRKAWKKLCDEALAELGAAPVEAARRMRMRYDNVLGEFDSQLLTRYLDAATSGGDDVLFVFTADHGETWGDSLPAGRSVEHIYDLHGRWMTDETTRVPLLVWGTGGQGAIPAGLAHDGLVRGVDVAPTLAALAGIPWPGERPVLEPRSPLQRERPLLSGLFDGNSLAASLMARRIPEPRDALTVTSHNALKPAVYPAAARKMWSRFALRTADRRYVWDGLYRMREVQELAAPLGTRITDRIKDKLVTRPGVWSRLAAERAAALGPAAKLDKSLFPRVGGGVDGASGEAEVDDDSGLEEAMRMLGYGD